MSPPQSTLPTLDRSNSCSNLGNNSGMGFVGPGTVAQQILPAPGQVLAKASSSVTLPVTLGAPLRFSSAETSSGATVLIPSAQLGALGQANFIPVLAIPSTATPGKVEIKRILPQQQKRPLRPLNTAATTSQEPATLSVSSSQQASESTRTLLQNVLRERSQPNSQQAQLIEPCSFNQVSIANTTSATSGFSTDIASNTCREMNISNSSAKSHISGSLSTTDSHFHNEGQTALSGTNSNTPSITAMNSSKPMPDLEQKVVIPSPALEEGLSTLGSADASDFMEFLDQIKDSSIRLKLASAGSTASLKSPPMSAFSQNSEMPPLQPAMPNSNSHGLEGLDFNSTQDGHASSQNNISALQNPNVNPALDVHEQHQIQRPSRSSLPFSSYSSEGISTHPVRPYRSSEPGVSYTSDHTNIPQSQNFKTLSFSAFGSSSIDTPPQTQTSFPVSNYADTFIDATQDEISNNSTYLQDFPPSQRLLQQQPMGLSLDQSAHQSSEIAFSATNFPPEPNVYSQKQNTDIQKPQQLPFIHSHQQQQQQQQNKVLYTFPAASSNTANTGFLQHPQVFDGNFSGFEASQQHQQRQQFAAPHQLFPQVSANVSHIPLNPQGYGLPQQSQQQQDNSVNLRPVASDSRSPGLTVDCSKGTSNTASNLNTTEATTSTTTNPMSKAAHLTNQRQADLIALLSKQLSRAEVVDIFPPALALTPRGTGAGYGVGMDLDSLLTDAQDGASHRGENSPLSSSLLADWLDLSSNISHADLEALEREMALQSPMHVSYGDLGL